MRTARDVIRKVQGQKWRIAGPRLRIERNVLARTGRRHPHAHGRILCYHSTGTPEWGVNDVEPRLFIEHLDRATSRGFRFVAAADIAAGPADEKSLAITFDDGLHSILNVVPELETRSIPYTVFVVAEWASEPGNRFLSWADLAELSRRGATVGSHSVSHPNFRGLSVVQRKDELERSREAIASHLGIMTDQFAIPFGQSSDWDESCTALAQEAGYSTIFAQSEARRPKGTVARSFVTKFDGPAEFNAILDGRFDHWEEWY